MSLYVRVYNNFYTHRKTMRLKAKIGDDAYWIVPRLWSIASEHQPDGNLSSYTSEELAMLIGCDKYASSILQALKDAGFLDNDGMLHDWDAHNGYHATFAERAKTAAEARWHKKKKGNEKKGKETSNASSIHEASPIDFWDKLKGIYDYLDVDAERKKMEGWLLTRKGRKLTERFAVNWLNKCDKPAPQAESKPGRWQSV